MSKDFNDISNKTDQSQKETNSIDINQEKMLKEINEIKREIRDISFKVDTMLEILNNFSIMLVDDNEESEDNYDDEENESWIPREEDEDWNSYDEDDDD